MIHLRCEHCGQAVRVPRTGAGQTGRCPRCEKKIVVPEIASDPITLVDPLPPRVEETTAPSERARLDAERASAADHSDEEWLAAVGITPLPQHTGQRQCPWPVDILLYPINASGLSVLALLIGTPLLAGLLVPAVRILGRFVALPLLIAGVGLGLYAACYFADCIYDSARGGTRAPDALSSKGTLGEMWSRASYLLAIDIVYVLPVVLYILFLRETDRAFWGLVVWATLLFPMGLLAIVMMDSPSALNPIFLLGSIVRIFLPYLGLMALFALPGALYWLALKTPSDESYPLWIGIVGLVVTPYAALVFAHLLGRFYWRYRERLDWGI